MNIPAVLRNTLLVLACMATSASWAQKPGNAVWKKTVARMIDLTAKDDTKHHLKDAGDSKYLSEMMADEVIAGKLTAYSNIDNNFSTRLTPAEVKNILGPKKDTVTVTDPVTGKEITKYITTDVNFETIQKFRLLEEWTFNPATGKTDIQITGIAPIKEIYSDDGSFRGIQAIFWLRYADALPVINRYDTYHPTGTLDMHIWDDYFLSDVKPKEAK